MAAAATGATAAQTTPAPARCVLDPSSLVCSEALLESVPPYSITVGPNTVIHPTALILALGGDIVIGANNVIEEQSVLVNPPASADAKLAAAKAVTLRMGDSNVIEVGAHVSARTIGSGNVFGCKCVVSSPYTIGDGCSIGARVVLGDDDTLAARAFVASDAALATSPTASSLASAAASAASASPPAITITVGAPPTTTATATATDSKTAAPSSATATASSKAPVPAGPDTTLASGTVVFGAAHERRHREVVAARYTEEATARTDALRTIIHQMHRIFAMPNGAATSADAPKA